MGSMMSRRATRQFSDDFKRQIVQLCQLGKSHADIAREYDLTRSAVSRWVREESGSGSFRAKDNRSPEENELIVLRKELQQLRMENDILKQAALIMGRK